MRFSYLFNDRYPKDKHTHTLKNSLLVFIFLKFSNFTANVNK